ncbi:hypothetical protein [Lacticaseibacillus mingshuiensis]|uniref:Uncharacterized protein n=1 Tax=Lacticaseibacillus mingshuiensis TaxID=2799574 RepID=A0ABW4CJN9_9LACO|nr:hypothetical protein [Lacticaseibacillus mingshuiensis]
MRKLVTAWPKMALLLGTPMAMHSHDAFALQQRLLTKARPAPLWFRGLTAHRHQTACNRNGGYGQFRAS